MGYNHTGVKRCAGRRAEPGRLYRVARQISTQRVYYEGVAQGQVYVDT